MTGKIYLEDGTIYRGRGFGHKGTNVGEIVFNTSMVGYDKIITDSSSAGQIIIMTYPIVGTYGINKDILDTTGLNASGLIISNLSSEPSNYQSDVSLDEFTKELGVVGVYDIDTRSLTKRVRKSGAMKCVITNENLSVNDLEKLIKERDLKSNFVEENLVEKVHIKGNGIKFAVLDFGASMEMINVFKEKGCDLRVFPYGTSYEEINKMNLDGIFIGNGPGDPKQANKAIEVIERFIEDRKPIFGIDLGHQLIALAQGAKTVKLKNGHRGGNHGVIDSNLDKAYIVNQNHGFIVDEESIIEKDFLVTHRNLNDETIEGMRHKSLPIFSVQFHPHDKTSYVDTEYLFDEFINNCEEAKNAVK